jgi:DNA-directed RNA polymerase specialized sigma subunit
MRKENKEEEEGSPSEDGELIDQREEGDEDQGQEDNSPEEILRSENPLSSEQSHTKIVPPLDPTREGELIKRLVDNKSERERLNQKPGQESLRTLVEPAWEIAEAYKPICVIFAKRIIIYYKRTMLNNSDLVSEGMSAVFEVACHFSPKEGETFFEKACDAIQQAMNRAINPERQYSISWDKLPDEIISKEDDPKKEDPQWEIIKKRTLNDLPLQDPPKNDDTKKDGTNKIIRQWKRIKKYIHRLNKIERKVVRLRYSIGRNPIMTRKEVGLKLKKSPQYIALIEKRALRNIAYLEERDIRAKNNKVRWTIHDFNSKLRERNLRLLHIPYIILSGKEKEGSNYILGPKQVDSLNWLLLSDYLSWFPKKGKGKLPNNFPIGRNLRYLLEGQLEIIMAFMPPKERYKEIQDVLDKLDNAGVRIQRLQDLFMTILVGRAGYLRQKYLFREASKRKKKKKTRRGFHITEKRHSLFSSLLANPKDISNLSKEEKTELKKAADEYYGFLQPRLGPPTHDYLYHPFNKFCKQISEDTLNQRRFWNEVFDLFHQLLPSVVDDNPSALRKHTLPSKRITFVNWVKENIRKFNGKVQTPPSYTSDGIPFYRMNVPEK